MLRLISLGIIVFSDVIMFAHRNINCLKAHQLVQPVQIKVGLAILYLCDKLTTTTSQPFYGPFSGTTPMSQCQKRTSGLYSASGDLQRQTH